MSKHDEARRAFLVGAAVGAGAAAGAALVPEAFAQQPQQPGATNTAAPGHDHAPGSGSGYGAALNVDESAAIKAFSERLMPGAPGKPGATVAVTLVNPLPVLRHTCEMPCRSSCIVNPVITKSSRPSLS